jgi:hypothetical protein
VDTDLGARFKNFNHKLLASDIIFICALSIIIVGLLLLAIKKCKGANLKNSTIIISAILIIPLTLVLALTPLLETLYPGEVGQNTFATILVVFTIIGTFAFFAWIILLITIFIKQTFLILTNKK